MEQKPITVAFATVLLVAPILRPPVQAIPQMPGQQRCIRVLGAEARKLADKLGREWFTCLRDAGKDSVADVEACAGADRDGTIGRASLKLSGVYDSKCTGVSKKGETLVPDFGATDPGTIETSARGVERNLYHALFGDDVEAAVLTDRSGRACQTGLARAAVRCQRTVLREYETCAKIALRSGAAVAGDVEEACLGSGAEAQPDPKGRLRKLCGEKVTKEVSKKCVGKGVALPSAAPGCDPADAADLSACIAKLAKCESCLHLRTVAALGRDCDLFDDGVRDGSCPPGPAFDPGDVVFLASDELAGRDSGTESAAEARYFLIQELAGIAEGLDSSKTGREAYLQAFSAGTNVLAVIAGSDLANEYVMVGAHYDHLGGSCEILEPGDTVCNGATDNAAGVAAVLYIARSIARAPSPPRRSVILAFWDSEEDGLLGSEHYAGNPLVPLVDTAAYVNFDILGANLLPSLRNFSAAVGAETGGPALRAIVDAAVSSSTLETGQLSFLFGQGRSDYVNLVDRGVPSVFFSDSTGGCYHTSEDEIDVVDFSKLEQQAEIGLDVTVALADTSTPPPFLGPEPALATFADAQVIHDAATRGLADLSLFPPSDQATLLQLKADLNVVIADGPGAFDPGDVTTLLLGTLKLVDILTRLPCDGYLAP